MSPDLKVGMAFEFEYTVPPIALVPNLYDLPTAKTMPPVLATGYMVGIMEFACLEGTKPFLDWPAEQSLGTKVEFTHLAATPAGMKIKVKAQLIELEGRRMRFAVQAWDEKDKITEGFHERTVIQFSKFQDKLRQKFNEQS
jgi:fluoroacetyl-CoA thioesterase